MTVVVVVLMLLSVRLQKSALGQGDKTLTKLSMPLHLHWQRCYWPLRLRSWFVILH